MKEKKKYEMRGGGIFPIYSKTYHKATVFKAAYYFLRHRQRYQWSRVEGPEADQYRSMRVHIHTHTHAHIL